ncbi:hypothetical protein RFI_16129 [Reticulomyxa filosa]|uniref:Uncharacterized protein n=1 Tax=Reticulomyxa filosa TaxID=46433 RepID=X6N4W7_RETFI|nr:hypothetical protein RFI_16129 [Reticulomyxa filosa]|eukprot:ETO21076.1 hypothetical protein RFI_16129 [Reticulomyxa filosa]
MSNGQLTYTNAIPLCYMTIFCTKTIFFLVVWCNMICYGTYISVRTQVGQLICFSLPNLILGLVISHLGVSLNNPLPFLLIVVHLGDFVNNALILGGFPFNVVFQYIFAFMLGIDLLLSMMQLKRSPSYGYWALVCGAWLLLTLLCCKALLFCCCDSSMQRKKDQLGHLQDEINTNHELDASIATSDDSVEDNNSGNESRRCCCGCSGETCFFWLISLCLVFGIHIPVCAIVIFSDEISFIQQRPSQFTQRSTYKDSSDQMALMIDGLLILPTFLVFLMVFIYVISAIIFRFLCCSFSISYRCLLYCFLSKEWFQPTSKHKRMLCFNLNSFFCYCLYACAYVWKDTDKGQFMTTQPRGIIL